MKRLIIVIIFCVLLIILLSPAFWTWVYKGSITQAEGVSLLKFVSIAGDYNIFIDNDFLGKVQNKQEKVFTGIKPGKRILKVHRVSDFEDFYFTFSREVNFMPFTQVELEWEAGPTLESSNGVLKYFTESSKLDTTELVIDTFPADCIVYINDQIVQNRFIEITEPTEQYIRVSHTDRYVQKDFKILLINPNTNEIPKNIRLNIEVYLYKRPI
ncbi:MAG: hypothetical protein KatS3mg083_005 [Candidatus Dojkabacteria bacterium]|nr:MAG: hypothetical protein KatS3mg083_005 [Candidatus Dojkabacteria bacterium]